MQTTLKGHEKGFARMEATTIPHMKRVKDRVKYILQMFPPAKGNDMLLIWRYYQVFEPDKIRISFTEFKDMMRATSMETIRRTRQKIQEAGEFLPTDRTILKRRRREEIIRSEIGEV